MKLEDVRKKIDRIDDAIFDFLVERFRLSAQAGTAKRQMDRPIRDKEREELILKRLSQKAQNMDLDESFVTDIFSRILAQSIRIQEKSNNSEFIKKR